MTVREMLARGDFNHMSQQRIDKTTVLVTLTKRGDPHIYKVKISGLYTPDERAFDEQILTNMTSVVFGYTPPL